MTTQQNRNGDMVDLLSTDFLRNDDPALSHLSLYSQIASLPVLVSYWANHADGGDLLDVTNNNYTLVGGGGTPTFNHGRLQFVNYNGTTYHSITHAAGPNLGILGTEAWVWGGGNRGLTLGGWVQGTGAAANQVAWSKSGTAGNLGYYVERRSTGAWRFAISGNGTTVSFVDSSNTTDNWTFITAMYDQLAGSIEIWVNGVRTENTTSIPASIFATTAPFTMGGLNAGGSLVGNIAHTYVCAANLSAIYPFMLWERARAQVNL